MLERAGLIVDPDAGGGGALVLADAEDDVALVANGGISAGIVCSVEEVVEADSWLELVLNVVLVHPALLSVSFVINWLVSRLV